MAKPSASRRSWRLVVWALLLRATRCHLLPAILTSLFTSLPSDVFFVGTCNDASKLPPEFARAERFDGVFFVDLPGRDQKDGIWSIYQRHYGLDAKQARPDDTNWTGAEIKSCCRLASLLDVPLLQAAQNVVPGEHTAASRRHVSHPPYR